MRRLIQALKNQILPPGKQFRKLRFGPAAGCTLLIDFRHHTRLYLGLYETELVPHFRSLLRPGYRCFDVGGQGGYDALLMAKWTGGPVVSFECEAEAAEEMRQTFAHNPYPIQTQEAFVGNQDDAMHITLDEAARQTFIPDFIKMDIEGAEAEALAGAKDLLTTRQPSLIVEVHGAEIEERCLALLRAHGYTPQIVNQRRWGHDLRPIAHNRWLICPGKP